MTAPPPLLQLLERPIPTAAVKPGAAGGDWSSLIGIVTAIVGNVLISFALNLQRYAHVRIQRDAARRRGDAAGGRSATSTQADAQLRRQSRLAEGLARKNARSSPERTENGLIYTHDRDEDHDENEEYDGARETDALLPHKARESSRSPSSTAGSDGDNEDGGADGNGKRKNYLKSPFWWLGISLMVVGEAGNFLAYGFAPASIVSPLGVVALISNCLIAPIMLKEAFRKRDVLGVLIAVGGAVTVVLSAKVSNPKLGPHQIWQLISRWEFLTYFGITSICIVTLMFASNSYGDRTVMIDIGLVGLFGGYTALSTKGVASLLSYRLLRVFTFPISYLLVAVLIGTAIMQIKYVNRALQRFNSTQVIPTQFVFFTIFVVVGSAILYRDFEQTTADKVGQFVGGVALTFIGVWCITSGRDTKSDDDEESMDEEQGIDLVDEEANGSEGANDTKNPSFKVTEDENDGIPNGVAIDGNGMSGRASAEDTFQPSTPQAKTEPASPLHDSPASFRTASSRLAQTPGRKPQMQTSVSSPLLPSQQARLASSLITPSKQSHLSVRQRGERQKSSSSALQIAPPSTPQFQIPRSTSHTPQGLTTAMPASTSTSAPRQLLSRHSIAAGILPGPYTSPLSSGLSVLVADSRRRDETDGASTNTVGGGGSVRRRSVRESRSRSHSRVLSMAAVGSAAAGTPAAPSSQAQPPEDAVAARPRLSGSANTVDVAGGLPLARHPAGGSDGGTQGGIPDS